MLLGEQDEDIEQYQKSLLDSYLGIIRRASGFGASKQESGEIQQLFKELASRDNGTWEHSIRVARFAAAFGDRFGLNEEQLVCLRLGALLHDVGKIGISNDILLKPGVLTEEEYLEVKKHPVIGEKMLHPVKLFYPIIPMVLYHHERYDGRGYPQELSGKEIPFEARIISVADAFEAMTSNRSYRTAMTIGDAVKEILHQSGRQFDPEIACAFGDIIQR
ncbi:MAG: HD-GYP domain-containing protein [Desulfitobacteriaceae bacterium]